MNRVSGGRLSRRELVAATGSLAMMACTPVRTTGRTAAASDWATDLNERLARLAGESPGTMGACIFDPASGASASWNGDRRFPHCSSFKASLAAMVVDLAAREEIDGDRVLRWTQDELMWVSPFTTRRLGEGASFLELAEATQITSDNAAANVLLRELGGPAALTAWWRAAGDPVSRLDRTEPALNNVPPGEVRDTTTPDAMARTVAAILYGDVLSPAGAYRLHGWMAQTQTGARRVRAGLPEGWRSGDKTGTAMSEGMGSAYVDIGYAVPPGRSPLTFAAYYLAKEVHEDMDPQSEGVLAAIGTALAAAVTPPPAG
ncbi:class A beta-lactamase [Qipengyuania sp. MTN3-11]|uniref:class A beta-lactamase n=1 Tax=Qipengyuania sp. MTN3-11 TaxID=3056557 RepID=UPI0036F2329E